MGKVLNHLRSPNFIFQADSAIQENMMAQINII